MLKCGNHRSISLFLSWWWWWWGWDSDSNDNADADTGECTTSTSTLTSRSTPTTPPTPTIPTTPAAAAAAIYILFLDNYFINKIAHPNLSLPRDCASPSSTFKGVQPHAATSLASRRLDLDLWTLLRRDAFPFFTQVVINRNARTFLAPPPCTERRKRLTYGWIHRFFSYFHLFHYGFAFHRTFLLNFRPQDLQMLGALSLELLIDTTGHH